MFILLTPCSTHTTPSCFALSPSLACPQNALRKLIPLADRVLVKKIEMQAKVSALSYYPPSGFSGAPHLVSKGFTWSTQPLLIYSHPPTPTLTYHTPLPHTVCWRHPSP